MKKLYIGFDLGDGETSIFYANRDIEAEGRAVVEVLDLPGGNRRPIPTMYGIHKKTGKVVLASTILSEIESVGDIAINFKNRPSDLLGRITEADLSKLNGQLNMQDADWNSVKLLQTPALLEYKMHVVNFVNAIFGDENFYKSFKGAMDETVKEIVVTVGHPTKWSSVDTRIYELILKESLLGEEQYADKKLTLCVAPESRAAFLTMRNKNIALKQGATLLIDIGSSTVDLTALQGGDSRRAVYNDGHDYLGARVIDFLIYELFLEKMEEIGALKQYEQVLKLNKDYRNYIIMQCRRAKERMYEDGEATKGSIYVDIGEYDAFKIPVQKQEINRLFVRPMGDVMKKYTRVSDEKLQRLGTASYLEEMRMFLMEQNALMVQKNIALKQVLLTGSASRVPAVRDVVQTVFRESAVINDLNPGEAIAVGLVYVGISDEKSEAFQKEAEKMLKEKTPAVVEKNLGDLAFNLSSEILDFVIKDEVIPEIKKWRVGAYKTLREMKNCIEKECNEAYIEKIIQNNSECKCEGFIADWLTEKIGKEMEENLKELCREYQIEVQNLGLKDLDAMSGLKNIGMNMSHMSEGVASGVADSFIKFVAIISGIFVGVCNTAILGGIITAISWLSLSFAISILTFLLFTPMAIPIAVGILGVGVVMGIKNGGDKIKDWMTEKILDADLPVWVRSKAMSDKKIKHTIDGERPKMLCSMRESIMTEENKEQLKVQIAALYNNLAREIVEQIKYVVESK